ncbi:hypothetical protein GCM10009828_010650 [Actinoplanes couchii]|uniref:Uncharacterized protein n=1 Tax=Actinoplanes couchii TaxID=403638 RepID=A0ABQ3X0T3_9ACTN|nr:hypothetical protein Aco03nite_005500 [Actinoplanes couchii]
MSSECRRSFEVAELTDIRVVRSRDGQDRAGHQALGASALVAAVVSLPVLGAGSMIVAVTATAALTLGAGFLLRSRSGRRRQLRAYYRGVDVEIFSSTDEREFEAFRRGLIRSKEARES